MENQKPIVELVNASIYYKSMGAENPILSDVNLSVYAGEMLYLVGRVGSGKSSLLRTLYGELPLRMGHGRVCDINLKGLKASAVPDLRRRLGVVFQEHNLLEEFTIYQNLEFVLRATGAVDSMVINRRIEDVLDTVDMSEKAHRYPRHVSGGQRQRACIARALLNAPRLIIADEPTGNLDPVSSYEIMSLFYQIASRSDCAVILSTHNTENLKNFPSRTMLCQGGVLSQTQ